MTFGTVQAVEARQLGSALVADYAAGATVLTVDLATDFDEDGGLLQLGTALLAYTAANVDTGELTLASPLVGTAAQDDPVYVVEAGGTAVEWTANVSTDEGDTITATIPTSLIPYFEEGTYTEPLQVEVQLRGGTYEVADQPTVPPSLDGAMVWNPHSFRDMNATNIPDTTYTAITDWTPGESDGVLASSTGYTIQYPGAYFIAVQAAFALNASGRRRVRILVNGTQVAYSALNADPGTNTYLSTFREVRLTELDVVTVEVWQDSGAVLGLFVSGGVSNFAMHRVSV